MKNRYYGTKKVEFEGIIFDSSPECLRYQVLREAQRRGLISGLELQKLFTLIPRQTERVEVRLKTKTKIVEKFHEHPLTYTSDFVYVKEGKEIIEDVKGFVTEDYVIRRKLMRYLGHPIKEVHDPAEDYPEIALALGINIKKKPKKKSKKQQIHQNKDPENEPGLFD